MYTTYTPGRWMVNTLFSACMCLISQIHDQETLVQLKNQIREQTRKMGIDHATIEIELPSEACVLENC